MKFSQGKKVIMLGCFSGYDKKGGVETYVDSISRFLKSQGASVQSFPKSQNVKNSYSSLFKIMTSSMFKKVSASAIVIAQRPDDLYVFKLFKKKNKSICVLHGDNLRKMKLKKSKFIARVYQRMEKKGLKAANRIICVDQSTLDIYVKRYPFIKSKSRVIPVGVNTAIFKPMDKQKCRKSLDISKDAKVMLVAARLEKEKNIGATIKLVKTYFDNGNYILLIAGTGKEELMLKEISKNIKKAKVKFLGHVQYEKLPEVINACDVVLVPSLFESGPLIIIEAMACGIPSVSTDVGRAKTFLANSDCGAVVNNIDKTFAEQVKIFLSLNYSIKENCMERVKLFSFHNTGAETLKLIRKLE